MIDKKIKKITKMAMRGKSAKEIANAVGLSAGAIYTRLSRLGVKIKKDRCKSAVIYSIKHGCKATAEKYKMNIEAVHQYRNKYL